MNFNQLMQFFGFEKKLISYETTEVFKNSGIPEHTFITRNSINSRIENAIRSRNKAISFVGYSKSGKTVYRKKFFDENKFKRIVFRCNDFASIADLYSQIASDLNLGQIVSSTNSSSKKNSQQALAGIGVKDVANLSTTESSEVQYAIAQTNEHSRIPIDVNFICNRISDGIKGDLVIFLEDYHLANKEFNRVFSQDLKHFTDDDILFVIVGIPSAPGRALKNNPDLSGRMVHVNFDYLQKDEIITLIEKGEHLLNVHFTTEVREQIIKHSFKNAYLVQSICQKILVDKGIDETSPRKITISEISLVDTACKKITDELNDNYQPIYNAIKGGVRRQQTRKIYNQYEEVLKYIKSQPIEELENGVPSKVVSAWAWNNITAEKKIQIVQKDEKYKSLKTFQGSLTQQVDDAFKYIGTALEKSNAKPIIVVIEDKIHVMDLVFKFYLNWRSDTK